VSQQTQTAYFVVGGSCHTRTWYDILSWLSPGGLNKANHGGSVGIASLQAKIWIVHFLNMKQCNMSFHRST